jgi:hypothetical protein
MFIKETSRIVFLCLLVYLTGCSASQEVRDIEELKSAPSKIMIDGKSLTLEVYIWRDFMPTTDTFVNTGIMGSIKIKTSDSTQIPASLTVTKLWILNKDSVWETKPVRTNFLAPDVLEIFVSRGPSWDKGIKTDVVTEIKLNNNVKLLGIKNQEIHAVY